MVAIILPDDRLRVQLPQPGIVVGARGDEVRAVGAEGTVPDPALVGLEGGFERKGAGLALGGEAFVALDVVRRGRVDGPDARVVVGGAGRQVADVGAQQDARHVGVVGLEGGDGDEGGDVAVLDHAPDVDVALREGGEKK